jgi:excinuclease ABC subunit A
VHGGEIVAQGTLKPTSSRPRAASPAITSPAARIEVPAKRRKGNGHQITVQARAPTTCAGVTASIPLGTFTCITGVSGSGKSSLTIDTLYAGAARELNGARVIAGPHDKDHRPRSTATR